jgi:CRISPR-associated exonuclease Cas4
MESSLLDLLAEMKRDEHKKEVARSHEQVSRCARCGFRKVCDQSLV